MTSEAWLEDVFGSIDAMDSEKFATFIDSEGVFIFGNWPSVEGRENIKGAVEQFFESIKGFSHKLFDSWRVDDTVIVHGEVTYTRHDDKQVSMQFMNLFKMNGQVIKHYQIFIDMGPLYAE